MTLLKAAMEFAQDKVLRARTMIDRMPEAGTTTAIRRARARMALRHVIDARAQLAAAEALIDIELDELEKSA